MIILIYKITYRIKRYILILVYKFHSILKNNKSINNNIFFIKTNPNNIEYISIFNEGIYLYNNDIFGCNDGVWDYYKIKFNSNIIYKMMYFSNKKHKIYTNNKHNKIVNNLNNIKNSLSLHGYKTQYELGRITKTKIIGKWILPAHEIYVGMDRYGKLFRITGGRHRLAIAQLENISEIYAILIVWHPKGEKSLPENRRLITDSVESFTPL